MGQESVEALLSPLLKVSRPMAACAKCRSAKIKCTFDGKSAACSSCERAGKGKECSSATDEFARGKERSYTSALESAIQRLQKKIDATRTREARHASLASFVQVGPSLYRKPVSTTRRKEAGDVDDLVSDFCILTVNATSRDFQGFSSTMSFAKMLKAISLKEPLPVSQDTTLPPRQVVSDLTNHYFENIHVLLPFFSETDFMGSISRMHNEAANLTTISPFDMWCFHLVIAISSASLCQTRGDERYNLAIRNISIAMHISEHVLHPGSLSGIQALLLLVQYSLFDPEYFDSWYLVGMASRLVVDLGLHCEPAPETKVSKHALDLRRRIFYCTYALDRLISMALGSTFSFTDDSAPNVLLPTLATDLEARSPTQLFMRSVRPSLFLFDIRRVQSAFFQRTRWSSRREWDKDTASSYISSTLDDINAWKSTLPEHFSPKHLQLFYIESLYSQVMTLSPCQVIPPNSFSDADKSMLFDCAIRYSDQLRSMISDPALRSCLSYADCCRARYVAKQFQSLMWANFDMLTKPAMQANVPDFSYVDNYARAISFLENMSHVFVWPKERWGFSALEETYAQESAVLLARLRSRHQESRSNAPLPVQLPELINTTTVETVGSGMTYPDTGATPMLGHSVSFYHDNPPSYTSPDMQSANLMRSSQWGPRGEQSQSDLPLGTLPRRSYQFGG